jgi:hypothetical protein
MRHLHVLAVSICLSGCTAILGDASSNVEGDEDFDTDECKIEGEQIGQEGYVMRLGDRRVTFQDWVTKGEANEYMGFSLVISGDDSVNYVVKAGTQRYPSSATTWSHPQGLAANAISNVDVCEECTDGSCDGGDGGDGGGDGGGDDTCIECPDPGDGSGSDTGGDTGGDGPLT